MNKQLRYFTEDDIHRWENESITNCSFSSDDVRKERIPC